jgi:thiol-disulfide isomerase/thioredoxin
MTERRKRTHKQRAQVISMVMVGAGLLLIGAVALLFLPKSDGQSASEIPGSVVPMRVDFLAPVLQLKDLQGRPVSLKDYLGQVVLVNNWATWCPPCRAEMPVLNAYYQDHQPQGFSLVGIEAGETASEVADFVNQNGLAFSIWIDPRNAALAAFSNGALPNSYVIDRKGMVVLSWTGPINRSMLEKYVTPVIEE